MVVSRQICHVDEKYVRKKYVLPKGEEVGTVRYVCNGCGKTRESHNLAVCSCCKAVYNCNKACQMMGWKVDGVATRNMSHRECCLDFVKDRKEFEQDPNGAVVRARGFPWTKHHHTSRVFVLKEFLARRGLFGRMGFWASPHLVGDDSTGWCHGNMLLDKSLLSIKEGWVRLQDGEIPSGPAPCRPIHSWAHYVKLRNLCGSSIAPLLLTNVLTIYQMIIHEFEFRRRRPRNGEFFVIYVLGAESELN